MSLEMIPLISFVVVTTFTPGPNNISSASTEPILRVIGAAYILWLAIGTTRASYSFNSSNVSPMGFTKGFFLQTLNPKVAVYGLTLYSTFLSSAPENYVVLTAFAIVFALTAFCATSTWALCGAAIRRKARIGDGQSAEVAAANPFRSYFDAPRIPKNDLTNRIGEPCSGDANGRGL